MTHRSVEEYRTKLGEILLSGNKEEGVNIVKSALEGGMTATAFFLDVIKPELSEIGKKFERLDIFLPELMKSAVVVKAMQADVLDAAIANEQSGESIVSGMVVIGTMQGDIHDIGKNMVSLMLQVNGFDVVDLGTDVSPKQLIQAAKEKNAKIIAMSSLLTTSMPYMNDVIERLKALEIRDQFKVIVGGAPLTPEHSAEIGADAYGSDAIAAVEQCVKLLS